MAMRKKTHVFPSVVYLARVCGRVSVAFPRSCGVVISIALFNDAYIILL